MTSAKVLVIDDEPQIRRVVRNAIPPDAGEVIEAATGKDGIDKAAAERPQLIVLDLGLPDMDGAAVCQEIRAWSSAPIIVLSARHSPQEKAELLDAGADDYVTKPFSTIELKARLRAALRRAKLSLATESDKPIVADGLTIDLVKPSVTRNAKPIHLTKTEWDVLRTLVRHSGRTLTHRQIFSEVWGNSYGDAQQYLRVHIRSLRRKMETDPVRPRLIVTEPGVGYRFEPSQ